MPAGLSWRGGGWLLGPLVEGLKEVCGGEVCGFPPVCLIVSAAWVGDVDVDLPHVGYVLQESVLYPGIVSGEDGLTVQGSENVCSWLTTLIETRCIDDFIESHPEPDMYSSTFCAE